MSSQHVSHLPTPLPGQSSTPPPLSTSLSSSNPLSPSSSHFNPNFGSAPTATARPKSASTLVPTNTVTTRDGITVRVRIDPALTVVDVVRQLCVSLKVPEPPTQFALRDDSDGLVTNENLRRAIAAKSALRLVRAPALEAADLVEKLQSREEKGLKLALFSLQKYIKVRRLFVGFFLAQPQY
jgi:engulfment/cell motility protein 1